MRTFLQRIMALWINVDLIQGSGDKQIVDAVKAKMRSLKLQNQLDKKITAKTETKLVSLSLTGTVIVIRCLKTVLHGSWEWIYEVWTACSESNETQHQLCFLDEA